MISENIWKVLSNIHTAIPGIITQYNAETCTALVQPAIQRKYTEAQKAINLPVLSDAPVIFPRWGSAMIKPPVDQVTGPCLIIFSERSIDRFLIAGDVVDPRDARKFDLSDGFILPGVTTEKNPAPRGTDDSLELLYNSSKIGIKKSGGIDIQNGAVNLVSTLESLVTELMSIKVQTPTGPGTLDPASIQKLQSIKTQISQLGK